MKHPGSTPAFSLTEILTASAILAVMFAIMFGILQQTSKGWQAANRKVEASQVARMALEQIARDLEFCMAVATNNVPVPSGATVNYAFGFVHGDEATSLPGMDLATFPLSSPNDLLFLVTPYAASLRSASADLAEVGYIPVRVTQTTNGMKRGRYYLLRHFPVSTDTNDPTNSFAGQLILNTDFLANPTGWETTPAAVNATNRLPFVDNCLRFDVKFIDGTGATNATWPRPGDPNWTGLPRAAEITLCVVDDRTAERLARIAPEGLGAELGNLPDNVDAMAQEEVKATLREGVTTLRRRVSFRNGQP